MITLIDNWNVKEDTIQLNNQEEKMDLPYKSYLNRVESYAC